MQKKKDVHHENAIGEDVKYRYYSLTNKICVFLSSVFMLLYFVFMFTDDIFFMTVVSRFSNDIL